jgi:ubiquinone/menaquinone biosynthesis C-methylase UbiE
MKIWAGSFRWSQPEMHMDEAEWAETQADSGEMYEALLVPAIFDEWAPKMLAAGQVGAGDRVLDVACGTGVVARHALDAVGSGGSVVGVDLSESMLRVAKRMAPAVDWRLGDAQNLPCASESFDVVLSQAGLMFIPDRVAALAEMRRVLRPGGRLAVQVWGPSPANRDFGSIVLKYLGPEVADRYLSPWSYPDPADLLDVTRRAGFDNADVAVEVGMSTFASVEAFIAAQSSILLAGLDTEDLVVETTRLFADYTQPDGTIHIPSPGNLATATKK